jgi:hypothetical protein
MIILGVTGTIFQAIFTLLLELSTKHKSINQFAVGMVMYSLVTAIVIPFYTCGMNYACEITYPVGESINGGIMMSASQLSGIGGTFLCDWLINDYPSKSYLTNIIMLLFFIFACVFIFLFDEKLDREEIEKAGREAEKNENKKAEIENVQKENNNEEDKEKNENGENVQKIQISPVQTERPLVIKENEQNNNIATNLLKAN